MYRSQYDENKGILLSTPIHDEHSHPADAWRTLAMGLRENTTSKRTTPRNLGRYDPYKVDYNVQNDWDVYNG